MVIDAYLYTLQDDGKIIEHHGKVELGYSRHFFKEDLNRELPHFGRVAKEEGLVCFDSMWFKERKTKKFVKKEFAKNYERSIKYTKKRLEDLEVKMKILDV